MHWNGHGSLIRRSGDFAMPASIRLFAAGAVIAASTLSASPSAARIPPKGRAADSPAVRYAAIRYDEPTGSYCVGFDPATGARPPRVECRPPEPRDDIGIGITRR
jgi:hypothetical protein